MAAGLVRNFLMPPLTPAYFPLIFQHSPLREDEEKMLEEEPESRDAGGEREVAVEEEEEDDEDEDDEEESEAQEEEEDGSEDAFPSPAHPSLDMTNQLLRFADLISRDVQRYFGRCSGSERDSCDVYSEAVPVATGGRLRYYDDLLKLARARSPEDADGSSASCSTDPGSSSSNSSLGPLAELFQERGPTQGRGRPMIKRHLPLSFWTEPVPGCPLLASGQVADAGSDAHSLNDDAETHTLAHHSAHGLEGCTQPDFSDLLAYWDPELTHTLTENTHVDGEHI